MRKYIMSVLLLLGLVLCITGCDSEVQLPTKTGGGGLQQIFDPATGQYR
ncbi:MAG: hypothetical protein FWG50_08890 [Kiritimatiellaeota bacterium]|nr:hypothetical protein [Kiritimatiellota bacterium]